MLVIAAIVGAITLIPGFVAFPTDAMLLDSGAGYMQIGAFLSTLMMVGILTIFNTKLGMKSFSIAIYSFKEMALVIPPVFVLLGLLDIWIPRQTMMKYMGEDSGIKGIILSIIIGSAAAGPLYGAFPVAAVFMKKGVKFSNILIFIGAWSTTKIPMFFFENTALGSKFAITRLLIDIPGIIIIAYLLSAVISKDEITEICQPPTTKVTSVHL